jgi:hypothetical protein
MMKNGPYKLQLSRPAYSPPSSNSDFHCTQAAGKKYLQCRRPSYYRCFLDDHSSVGDRRLSEMFSTLERFLTLSRLRIAGRLCAEVESRKLFQSSLLLATFIFITDDKTQSNGVLSSALNERKF